MMDDSFISRLNQALSTAKSYLLSKKTPNIGRKDTVPMSGEDLDILDQLSVFLPWESCDDNGLVITRGEGPDRPEGIAFTIEITPQTGLTDTMEETLIGLANDVPVGTCFQLSTFASPYVEEKTRALLNALDLNAAPNSSVAHCYEHAIVRRKSLLDHLTRETGRLGVPIRHFRSWLSVVLPTPDPASSEAKEMALRLRDGMRATLQQSNLFGGFWTRNTLVETASQLLNPAALTLPGFEPLEADPFNSPAESVLFPDSTFQVTSRGINVTCADSIEPVTVVALSAVRYPRDWSTAQASFLLGEIERGGTQLPCPFIVTSLCQTLNAANQKVMAETHRCRALQMSQTPLATMTPYYHEKAREWSIALESFKGDGGLAFVGHQVLLMPYKSQVSNVMNTARGIARKVGLELRPLTTLHTLGYFSHLPMMAGPLLMGDLHKSGLLPRRTVATALRGAPLIAEWQGTGGRGNTGEIKPLLTLVGRRGQLMHVDPFANTAGGYSMTIVGKSGSGKSVVMNNLAFSTLSQGGRVWIIDVGRSYEKVTTLLEGAFLIFNEDSVWDLNPLRLLAVNTEEGLREGIESVVAILGELLSPQRTLSDFEKSVLLNALTVTATRAFKENRIPLLIDLYQVMQEQNPSGDQRINDLCIMLRPYIDGPLAKWVNGTGKPLSFTHALTVLELEGLGQHPALRQAALMTLMVLIGRAMEEDRQQVKLVMIDEAWDLMGSGHAGHFIESGFRRARKHNGAFVVATQSMADFFKSESAKAAWDSADTRLWLRQDIQTVESLDAQGLFCSDDWFKKTLASLTTVSGSYSEMIVQVGDGPRSVGRLVLDDFMRVLFSSHPEEFSAVQAWCKQGASMAMAVEAVAQGHLHPSPELLNTLLAHHTKEGANHG